MAELTDIGETSASATPMFVGLHGAVRKTGKRRAGSSWRAKPW